MDSCRICPHPQFVEILFAYRTQVKSVFSDVLCLPSLDYINITWFNTMHHFMSISSMPALDLHLYNTKLWQHDLMYNIKKIPKSRLLLWEDLYCHDYAILLKQHKQYKNYLQIGYCIHTVIENNSCILSFESRCNIQDIPHNTIFNYTDLSAIGYYCTQSLQQLFTHACSFME